MFRKILFILVLILSVVVSIVVTFLTGVFFLILVVFLPLIYYFRGGVKPSEENSTNADKENPPLLYCPNCGAHIINQFSYCPRCGIRLKDTD